MGKTKDLASIIGTTGLLASQQSLDAINKMHQQRRARMGRPTEAGITMKEQIDNLEEKIDILIKLLGKEDEVKTIKKLQE